MVLKKVLQLTFYGFLNQVIHMKKYAQIQKNYTQIMTDFKDGPIFSIIG